MGGRCGGGAPSATTQSWSSIESSLLTGETAPRCTVARPPAAGDDWEPKGLNEHVLKEPGGGEGPEGGEARRNPRPRWSAEADQGEAGQGVADQGVAAEAVAEAVAEGAHAASRVFRSYEDTLPRVKVRGRGRGRAPVVVDGLLRGIGLARLQG